MSYVGQPLNRTDGALKVCGLATYAAEFNLPSMLHAVMVQSTVPNGRVARIDTDAASASPGVVKVYTHLNAPRLPQGGKAAFKPPAGRMLSLLQDDSVAYNGQPIALVVADTPERARYAARLLRVRYSTASAMTDFDVAKLNAHRPEKVQGSDADTQRGDAAAGWRDGTVQIQARYTTPIEHHNPMEPHATIASWTGEALTLYDATQYVSGVKETIAMTLGVAPEKVTVICPFVGGGFGCKGSAWSHVALAAMAARDVGRPVKLVLDRTQMFVFFFYRPKTEQMLRSAARPDGSLAMLQHDVVSETSMLEDWVEPSAIVTRMLYASDSQGTTHRLAKMNVATPTFTRAPGEASGSFALETSMDELAYALKMDPLALRLRNHADRDLGKNLPFSSKSLKDCYRVASERFGWAQRPAQPGTLRDGPWRVGMGMATATYPTNRSAAAASVSILPNGSAIVRSGTQDLGTGTYTVMTQVAADAIGLPIGRVRFELGDSRMPKAPVSGGSQSAASVSAAVHEAGLAARAKLVELAIADVNSPLHGVLPGDVVVLEGWLRSTKDTSRAEQVSSLLRRRGELPLEAQASSQPGDEKKNYSMHSFGAIFVEARVDEQLGIVRVPRVVAAYGIGRVLNAKTAHSQLMGGIVWGIGMALMEETHRDPRNGRYVNGNLAEYHVPVNADIDRIDISVVPETDAHINPLGVKGIGEIGITGVAAAIGNAVYHATGTRVRGLPITLDKLLGSRSAA